MKNKIGCFTLALMVNFSFANMAFGQTLMNEVYCPEPYIETCVPDFDRDTSCAYRYVTLGVGPIIFIPNIGVGYRERYSRFGWDTALSFSTVGYIHQLSSHLVGHYYLNPARRNSAYVGLGLLGSGIFTNGQRSTAAISPDFVFGKQLANSDNDKQFIEMHVGIPTVLMGSKHAHSTYLPLMYIKYGVQF